MKRPCPALDVKEDRMKRIRPLLLLAGLGLIVSCTPGPGLDDRPGPNWPDHVSRPRGAGHAPEFDAPSPSPSQSETPTATSPPRPDQATDRTELGYIPRSRWTSHRARRAHVNRMGYINRVTVHHEGWKTVYFTSWRRTVQRLREIRDSHVNGNGWGDVGYHFIIDRAGRVWQARKLKYQGAHVSDHNQHNIGVMLLGNFKEQYPSQEQINTLASVLGKLKDRYNIPDSNVHTHRELGETACPGRYLQSEVDQYRRTGHM